MIAHQARAGGFLYAAVKVVKIGLTILLYYLLQVSVMPHLKVAGIMPNLLMVCIAVMTVSFGKKYAFATGAVLGIMLESMSSNIRMLNLLMYPALALLSAQIFADMSDIKRELLRIRIAQRQTEKKPTVNTGVRRTRLHIDFRRKSADDMNAHVRILLNAVTLTAMYETVMILYILLDGVALQWVHIQRTFLTLIYTAVTCILMFPTRWFLGMYRRRRRPGMDEQGLGEAVDITEKELRAISLEPDMPMTASFLGKEGTQSAIMPDDATPTLDQHDDNKDEEKKDPAPRTDPDPEKEGNA